MTSTMTAQTELPPDPPPEAVVPSPEDISPQVDEDAGPDAGPDPDPDPDEKPDADTETTLTHPIHVHKHRLCHNPSKLPGLRFVDRGLLQAQNKPPAGLPSLPQSAVSPPCSGAGVDSRQVSTEPTTTNPGTARLENSAQGCPQSRLGPVTAVLDQSTEKVVEPVTHSTETPLPTPPQTLTVPSSLLLPVTEADEIQSRSADDTCTESVSTSNHRGRRASVVKHSPLSTSILSITEHSPPSQPSTYRTARTAAPVTTPIAARTGRSASLRILNVNATTATANSPSPLAPRSEVGTDSSRFHTPSSRPRPHRTSSWDYTTPASTNPPARRSFSLDSTSVPSPLSLRANKSNNTNEWATGQQEVISSKTVNSSLSNENNKIFPRRTSSASRPPSSYKPLPPGYVTSGRIPPIRSFRLPGFRKSYSPDMNTLSSRYYDTGDDGEDHDQRSRERSLRALEGRYTNDRAREGAHPDLDDDVAESENNTADIFMNIAREDSSASIPRRQANRGSDDEQSTVVSPACPCVLCSLKGWLRERCLVAHIFRLHIACPFAGSNAMLGS